ncbi:MAG: TspO/MBR family protein [Pseudomonadota bacterium]
MTPAQSARQLSFWVSLGGAFTIGAIGGALTQLGPWYGALSKPPFQPPDWAFGPAWTLIFVLSAYSAHRLWEVATSRALRIQVVALFLTNGALNLGWSYLFFFIQRPDLALVEAAALWLSVLIIIVVGGRRLPVVRLLMAPYLIWVTFAIALNGAIVELNKPFTG